MGRADFFPAVRHFLLFEKEAKTMNISFKRIHIARISCCRGFSEPHAHRDSMLISDSCVLLRLGSARTCQSQYHIAWNKLLPKRELSRSNQREL